MKSYIEVIKIAVHGTGGWRNDSSQKHCTKYFKNIYIIKYKIQLKEFTLRKYVKRLI